MNDVKANHFLERLQKPVWFRLFLLARLPLAWMAGLRLEEASRQHAVISLKYGYRTKNPFRSIYFAALSMAAEMSSGLLGFMYVRAAEEKVSMLLVHQSGDFTKKAVGRIHFTCRDGNALKQAIEMAIRTGEPQTVDTHSVGHDSQKDEVAHFTLRWSFKVKSN
jgi:hypothetical protein